MKVMKFGGTSVGSPQRMKEVCKLITQERGNIVVLSAMSGTTNSLVEIADYFRKGNPEGANIIINQLRNKYTGHIIDLYASGPVRQKMADFLDSEFTYLHTFSSVEFDDIAEKTVLAQGEIISTNMVTAYLREQGVKVLLINALDFMRLSENGEPDQPFIKKQLEAILEENPNYDLYLTQGFIARNAKGDIDNLQRGGSDYTASLIGAVLRAEEIQIWTDIDGMHNNDPRVVEGTKPVRQLNFEEAAELAYFGAKILHPTCIQPARYNGVPVRLLNTMNPAAPGTLINNEFVPGAIKAIAAKDNITSIKIVSSRMLLASGFLKRVFDIFGNYGTSIDMVTTSEVGVSLSIDDTSHLASIVEELKTCGTVLVDEDMCIVCVVGDLRWGNVGFESQITAALHDVPVRMISFGGSDHNISFLIRGADKKAALQALSAALFPEE
ncbi:MAG: aspartate kinase [Alloprevotella sp.]|nr:aspartate kinase [Alloprevotella sp.]